MRTPSAVLLSCLAAAPATAFQSVHVVNGGTGSALQTAIDAAASGDTVLVHGGGFGSISIQAKSLTLIAEPAHGTALNFLTIGSIAAGQRCVVAGFDITPNSLAPAVTVLVCGGSVRLEDVRAQGTVNSSVDALVVSGCADVACVRSVFAGGSQIPTPGPNQTPSYAAGRGVVCQGSQLALYESTMSGGDGQNDHFINTVFAGSGAGAGGSALECDATSTLLASRSSFTGGKGGTGRGLTCAHLPCGLAPTPGADGGAGILAIAGASVSVLDCAAQGGMGGVGGSGGQCCPQTTWPPGSNGQLGAAEQGAVTHFAGAGTALVAPSVVRVGNPLALSIQGTPGDVIFLAVSGQTRFAFDPFYSGVFLFGPAARRSSFGVVPGSGTLGVSIPVGTLPGGAQSAVRYLQVLARDPSGQLRLGSPAVVTLLDPSF
ncbi:MAG: hypothetical protein HZA53_09095 [Planctomycetes bacterium]|nr:hypothetical protein [Planctomycetota bacterium]